MAFVNEKTQFAVFDLGKGRASGIVKSEDISTSQKTILVRVVDYERNIYTNTLHVVYKSGIIKRHMVKHHVKILPPGIIPSGMKLEAA